MDALSEIRTSLREFCADWPLRKLPPAWSRCLDDAVPHAPVRNVVLSSEERVLAIQNALRYFPTKFHAELKPEFEFELQTRGHVYMYRFRPNFVLKAYPIDVLPWTCREAGAIMMMILNNLDCAIAQFPHELVTYGGNGQVFSNWIQFRLVMHYLSRMATDQTVVVYSGHPLGVFPSNAESPRMVVTNGMMVPNYSSRLDYDRCFALGVSQYGQMTAGSFCYIGPQGIVHGTTLTLLNAGRRYIPESPALAGKIYVTSGLGGMSGAQAKAAVIAGCVGVIAEVSSEALNKRFTQGWLMEKFVDLPALLQRIRRAVDAGEAVSLGYHGNVVDLLEFLIAQDVTPQLGSDQTSLHNPFNGGYFPVGQSFEDSLVMMRDDPASFKECVEKSLRRHVMAVNTLCARGMKFWDYGNAFLLEAGRAGADIFHEGTDKFKYPSYVEDIMGRIFSLGFGPFRWVCTSGSPDDLKLTDAIAANVIEDLMKSDDISDETKSQYLDNLHWIRAADSNSLVVGSQARILYTDKRGRVALATAFNDAISSSRLAGCQVIASRDHHDVSGTDSPWRETSDVKDGSRFCADMAVHNFVGDAMRGATWVSLHNGGGTGWGEAINGGFGMLLDGTPASQRKAQHMLAWDVTNGLARRSWAGSQQAQYACNLAMKDDPKLIITMPNTQ